MKTALLSFATFEFNVEHFTYSTIVVMWSRSLLCSKSFGRISWLKLRAPLKLSMLHQLTMVTTRMELTTRYTHLSLQILAFLGKLEVTPQVTAPTMVIEFRVAELNSIVPRLASLESRRLVSFSL